MRRKKLRVAIIQFPTLDGEVYKNYETLQRLLKKLNQPVDLIVLPEMWPSGFRVKEGTVLVKQTREVLNELSHFAQRKKTYIVGSHLTGKEGQYYNTASVISPRGKIVGQYRKVHLFQLGGENKKFQPGNKAVVTKTPIAKLGLSICYDLRFPELLRKEVLAGAEILVIPSAWPKERIDHYRSLLKARAIENLCFVVSANKIGKNAEGVLYGGHSIAFDPWGKMLGELGSQPGILHVTLDLEVLHKTRRSFPVFEARREEVYR
jgi:omega-amidase